MTKKMLAGAFVLALAAIAVPVQAQDALAGKTIKIGVLSDYSSQFAFFTGKYTLQGVEMAVEDFLKAHPNRKVEVVSADHQNKPDIGSTIVREWFDRGNVDAVADLPFSAVSLAVAPIAKEKNKVMLAASTATTALINEQCIPTAALWAYNAYALSASSIQAMLAAGDDTFFFISWDNATGAGSQAAATEIITKGGGKVVGSVKHPTGTPDMSSFVLQAQTSKAKVILLANAGEDLSNTIKSAGEFGVMKSQKMVGLIMSLVNVHQLGLKATAGMFYADGFYWDRTPETRAFAKRYFDRNGGTKMPDNVAAANYSETLHYLNAVDAVKTIDAQKVMEQMRKTPVNDMYTTGGVLRPDGQMIHDFFLFQVKTPEESKGPWDYLKVVQTVPKEKAFLPLSESKCPLVTKS